MTYAKQQNANKSVATSGAGGSHVSHDIFATKTLREILIN
jgi:hypothetical protein